MANIKSAKKRILVNETKAARNKAIKSKVKTCVRKLRPLLQTRMLRQQRQLLKLLLLRSTKLAARVFYHKNTCSRKISRLAKAVNGIA